MRIHHGRALHIEGAMALAGAVGDEGPFSVIEGRDPITDPLGGPWRGGPDGLTKSLEHGALSHRYGKRGIRRLLGMGSSLSLLRLDGMEQGLAGPCRSRTATEMHEWPGRQIGGHGTMGPSQMPLTPEGPCKRGGFTNTLASVIVGRSGGRSLPDGLRRTLFDACR